MFQGILLVRRRGRSGRRALTGAALAFVLTAGTVGFVASTESAAAAGSTTPDALIYVDATHSSGTVAKSTLGHNVLWQQGGLGLMDESTGQFYPNVIDQLTNVIKPGSMRYPGGTTAEVFHWQRAIGPLAGRSTNATQPTAGPSASSFGPDEFGQLLNLTGATGLITANFATGTAAEAAAFVAYMTGAPGSSSWADMRVANGHPAPYNVPYWEVGNEEYLSGSAYWRGGSPVSVGGPPNACSSVLTCMYIYGGTTSFTKQATVGYDNWTAAASKSRGTPSASFYAKFPPVRSGSDTVFVGGTAWTRVDSLSQAASGDQVYTMDDATGKITFGDGVHGATPSSGTAITLSYISGPHDGFLAYYQAMKAANPNIKVCSTDTTNDFLAAMGTALPYDCLEDHEYTRTQQVANNVPMPQYSDEMIATADDQANEIATRQKAVDYYAGRHVPLYETEYGQLLSSIPDDDPTYLESMDAALANASELANLIRMGVPVANRQLLAGPVAVGGTLPLKATSAITPGPDSFVTASGEIFNLFAPLAGGSLLDVQEPRNPALPDSFSQKTGSLSTVAVRNGNELDVLAINRNNSTDLSTQVNLNGAVATGRVDYTRLDGPDATSYNTAEDPDTVGFTTGQLRATGSSVSVELPEHSMTLLRIPVRSTGTGLSMDLSAPSQVAPGGTFILTAAVHNGTAGTAHATVTPSLPPGWVATPAAAPVNVARHGTTNVRFHVAVPAGTPELRFAPIGVLQSASGSTDKAVATSTIVHVPTNLTDAVSDSFNHQAIGSAPSGYVVTGPPGSVTVQPAPQGPGRVLQIHRDAGGTDVDADQPLPESSGPTQVRLSVSADQDLAGLNVQLLGSTGKPIVGMNFSAATNDDAAILWTDGATLMGPLTGNRALPYCNPRCFYQPGLTYTFEFDLDPASGTYKAYFNGELAEQPTIDTTAGTPATIHIQMPQGAAAGTFTIDNVSFATSTRS